MVEESAIDNVFPLPGSLPYELILSICSVSEDLANVSSKKECVKGGEDAIKGEKKGTGKNRRK